MGKKSIEIWGILQPEKKYIALRVAQKLQEIWKKSSILISSTNNIKNVKSFKNVSTKLQIRHCKKFFDSCSCKCNVLKNYLCLARRKVSPLEHKFLYDLRVMMIRGHDALVNKKLKKLIKRKINLFNPKKVEVTDQQRLQLWKTTPKLLKMIDW